MRRTLSDLFKFLVILLVAMSPFLLMLLLSGCGPSQHERAVQRAPEVKKFGLAHFDELDMDKDGTITEAEFKVALDSGKFTGTDHEVLQYIYDYRSWIGHVTKTETYPTTDLMPMPDGNGGFYYIPVAGTGTNYYYGISKEEFNTYPERLNQR